MHVLPYITSSGKIDKLVWDSCIQQGKNGLIYATTDYLNGLCEWDAIVWGDYEAVMPLPFRRKWGIKYYYTPSFIQQLGVFINAGSNYPAYSTIASVIGQNVLLADISFNYFNQTMLPAVGKKEKLNQVLNLDEGYEKIYANYTNDLKRNLKQAASHGLVFKNSDNIEAAIKTYQSLYAARMPQVKPGEYQNFTQLCKQLYQQQKCFVTEVYDAHQQLMACGIFLFDGKRIYNIASSTLPAGRKKSANHFLLDEVIKIYAGQQVIFDFEGSDLPGVQQFYLQFGAVYQNYAICRINRLPAILKWLKPQL